MARYSQGWMDFNGVRSTEMGVRVIGFPSRPRPARRGALIPVPGRSGSLWLDDGAYETVQLKVKLRLERGASRNAVSAWLTGYGLLRFSEDAPFAYHANAISRYEYKPFLPGCRMDDFEITFDCDPFLYESDPESFLLDTNPKTLVNPGTVPAEPLLVISGTGRVVVTVGGVSVTLDGLVAGSPITIDCDAKCAYKGAIANQVSMTLNDHAWPTLPIGDTTIGWAGNASVKITPHWRWL